MYKYNIEDIEYVFNTLTRDFSATGKTCRLCVETTSDTCADCRFNRGTASNTICALRLSFKEYRDLLMLHYPECFI